MEEIIAAGIDAKHSNEDQIAPFAQWIGALIFSHRPLWSPPRSHLLCCNDPKTVYEEVLMRGNLNTAGSPKDLRLGSGNSIPHYVPVGSSYLAMIRAAREIRSRELN